MAKLKGVEAGRASGISRWVVAALPPRVPCSSVVSICRVMEGAVSGVKARVRISGMGGDTAGFRRVAGAGVVSRVPPVLWELAKPETLPDAVTVLAGGERPDVAVPSRDPPRLETATWDVGPSVAASAADEF